jgi:hypothetical protein
MLHRRLDAFQEEKRKVPIEYMGNNHQAVLQILS